MSEQIGERLTEALRRAGWDQVRLADELGVSKSKITRIITGENKRIFMPEVIQMAKMLGVNAAWLAGWVDDPNPAPRLVESKPIPLLGTIAAGVPLYAAQNILDYLPAPRHDQSDFALQVKGDSMTGDCIPDGSIVFCKRTEDVEDGEIAVCIVDGEEATLKHIYRHDNIVILRASNPNYRDIVLSSKERKSLSIVGKALGVYYELRR